MKIITLQRFAVCSRCEAVLEPGMKALYYSLNDIECLEHKKEDTMTKKAQETQEAEKTFSDVSGGGQFYPDLPKRGLDEVIEGTYRFVDATIVEEFETKFGMSTFCLLLLEDLDSGDQFTTLCGGMVVVKKIRQALDRKLLPLIGTIVKPGRYYDIQ